jgi:hypothetical protein
MTQIRNHTPIEAFMSGSRPGPCYRIDVQTGERTELKRTAPPPDPTMRSANNAFWHSVKRKAFSKPNGSA